MWTKIIHLWYAIDFILDELILKCQITLFQTFIGRTCMWKCFWEWASFGLLKSSVTLTVILYMKGHGKLLSILDILLMKYKSQTRAQFYDNQNTVYSRYLFDAINALQGLWVFLMFVCRPDATKRIAKTTGLDTTKLYSVLTSGTKAKKSNVRVSMNKY